MVLADGRLLLAGPGDAPGTSLLRWTERGNAEQAITAPAVRLSADGAHWAFTDWSGTGLTWESRRADDGFRRRHEASRAVVMLPECRRSGQSHGRTAEQTVLTRPSTATSRQPPDPAPPCDFDAPYPEACRCSPYLSPKEVPEVFPKGGHHLGHRAFGARPAAVANHCSSAVPTVGRVGPR